MKHFALVWLWTMAVFASAQTPLEQGITFDGSRQSIWPGAYYLLDEDHAYQAKQFLTDPPFHLQTSTSAPNLGFVKGQVWVWFQVKAVPEQPLLLQLGFPHFDQVDIYIFDETGLQSTQLEVITSQAYSHHPYPNQFPTTELPSLSSGSVVVLKLRSEHPMRLPITLADQSEYVKNQMGRMAIIYVSLGVLLALFVYNLILFLSTKRIYYLYYCMNLGLLQLFFLIDLGFARYVLSPDHWLNQIQAWAVSVCCAFVFAILFAQSFLRLSSHYPNWHRWFQVLIGLVILVIGLVLFASEEIAIAFYLVVSALYQLSVLAVSIIVLRDGFRPARYFLMAWLFLAAGGFIYQLTIIGSIKINLWTEHAFLIGTVLEALLLSWALAELINKLQTDQITNEKHYQSILKKTSKRLSAALSSAEKHKKVRDIFLKHISHELKTPLNSIQHVLELNLQGLQASSEMVHDANHSTRLISRHIDKLLMNTELGASDPEFELEKIDIKTTLKNWNYDFSYQCRALSTEFSLVSNLVDWDELTGTIRPVYLVLTELIYNIANTQVDSILLTLNHQAATQELNIQLELHNPDGSMGNQKISIIENPNDLDFVEKVIALQKGHWDFIGEAHTFLVEITVPNFHVDKKPQGTQLPKKVLVIEDNEINQKVMVSMLTRMGIQFEIAVNGQEGLQKQASNPAEVILMDCQMPIMDGFDTTLAIRQNIQRYKTPIIIAVSANSMEIDKTRCISVGMDDFIAKPVRMEELRSCLLRWYNV